MHRGVRDMENAQMAQNTEAAQEFERIQREFETQNPDLAEAIKVMNMSLPDYLAALSYRQGAEIGAASEHSTPLADTQITYAV